MTALAAVPERDALAWPEERRGLIVQYLERGENTRVAWVQWQLVVAIDRGGEELPHGWLVEATAPDHQVVRPARVEPVRLALPTWVQAEEREESVAAHGILHPPRRPGAGQLEAEREWHPDQAAAGSLAQGNYCLIQYLVMGTSSSAPAFEISRDLAVLQSATRVLTGVALRSLEALDGAVTLPQFRMLAVLADLGQVRSAQVARALGLEASTVTRLADRMVSAGHVVRGTDLRHRSVVTLELTATGRRLVDRVETWRREELTRIMRELSPRQQGQVTAALRLLVEAAGPGYGAIPAAIVPARLASGPLAVT
jgi:DNA-binding MarR family transcriptional regulator